MENVERVSKKKIDKTKIATKLMAGFLALLMIAGTVGTVIYYIIKFVIKK